MDGGSDDGDKKTPPGVAQNGDDERGNTLWEQMTAREGRDAARRAGMSVGDWQAERQLQEALRESAQVKQTSCTCDPHHAYFRILSSTAAASVQDRCRARSDQIFCF